MYGVPTELGSLLGTCRQIYHTLECLGYIIVSLTGAIILPTHKMHYYKGKSLNITIHLYCLSPVRLGPI